MPTSTITTVSGYVALGAIGAAAYYVSTKKNTKIKTKTLAPPVITESAPPVKSTKAKAKRSKAFKSTNTATTTATDFAPAVEPVSTKNTSGTTKDELSNAEFARQMAGLKEGAALVPKSSTPKNQKKKVKSVKQSKVAQEFDSHDENTAASTSTGRDAEESPATSPEVKPVDSTGIADMLDAPAAAPTVLRLTDTNAAKAKPKAKKEEAPVETKKQRQNRKKAEAAKAANAEAEKERQVLLEKQRRTARIAEGRPAKDGSQSAAAAKSAWTPEAVAPAVAAVDLLDTLSAPTPAPVAAAPKAVAPTLTEEEQIALVTEDSAEWNTVTKKSGKKFKKAAPAEETVPEAKVEAAPAPAASKAASPAPKTVEAPTKPSKVFGSFTALSPASVSDDEQEWEI